MWMAARLWNAKLVSALRLSQTPQSTAGWYAICSILLAYQPYIQFLCVHSLTRLFRPIIFSTLPGKLCRLTKQRVYEVVMELMSLIPFPKNGGHLHKEDNGIISALSAPLLRWFHYICISCGRDDCYHAQNLWQEALQFFSCLPPPLD